MNLIDSIFDEYLELNTDESQELNTNESQELNTNEYQELNTSKKKDYKLGEKIPNFIGNLKIEGYFSILGENEYYGTKIKHCYICSNTWNKDYQYVLLVFKCFIIGNTNYIKEKYICEPLYINWSYICNDKESEYHTILIRHTKKKNGRYKMKIHFNKFNQLEYDYMFFKFIINNKYIPYRNIFIHNSEHFDKQNLTKSIQNN